MIAYISVFTSAIAGMLLTIVSLSQRFPSALTLLYKSVATWCLIFFSGAGSVLFTKIMEAIGTKVIEQPTLNMILLGILGAGIFAGVVSRVSISGPLQQDTVKHLQTIRDMAFAFLEDRISRKVLQLVEERIRNLTIDVDPDLIVEEASRLIGGPSELDADEKQCIRVHFDELATAGDYAEIVRVLLKHYDVDFVVKQLFDAAEARKTFTLPLTRPPYPEGSDNIASETDTDKTSGT